MYNIIYFLFFFQKKKDLQTRCRRDSMRFARHTMHFPNEALAHCAVHVRKFANFTCVFCFSHPRANMVIVRIKDIDIKTNRLIDRHTFVDNCFLKNALCGPFGFLIF